MSGQMKTSTRRLAMLVVIVSVLSGISTSAHDMWIEPSTFFPDVGAIVSLRLRVGVDFVGDPLPRDPRLIKQFVFDDGSGRKPVVGRDGADPAGLLRSASPATVVVGYHSHPSPVAQTAEKFNQYLKEEGLEEVAALRATRNETTAAVREIFSRCAKSLLQSGPLVEGAGDKMLGLTLELVAEQNPLTIRRDEVVPFRLVYEGRPLPRTLVVAMNRRNPLEKLTARTDEQGRVTLRVAQPGVWLVKAVHMIPAPAGSNADWASYWASLTFERKG